MALPADGVFADFGCGSGGVALWLTRESGARSVGIDRKRDAIELAKKRVPEWELTGRVEFRCADFADTGLETGSLDTVVGMDALSPGPEVDAALREAHRILKPGGRLVFTAREAPVGTERWRRLGPEWTTALERSGFDVVRCMHRPEVSTLWRHVYDQWVAHEEPLRAELGDSTVDGLLAEVRRVGPTMADDRDWLLITAARNG
jgi:ubiquinone/menaquinone biosynthesis C-methylase UbiE